MDVARQAGISHEDILEATLVGNPIMHHLLLGIDPVELGGAPFALAIDHSLTLRANVIDFKLNRNARIYVLPCIAGHVGADAAGMVLAERPDLGEEMTLLVDVGTNAEIVLGNQPTPGGLLQPDGPRVRGRADQLRSARGAGRDRARAHRPRDARATLQSHRFRPLVRRCGLRRRRPRPPASPACADPASSRSSRKCTSPASSIRTACWTAAWRRARRASSRTAERSRTCCIEARCEMKITQTDVRAIQLAKAALYAGIALLMERLGIDHVDRIRLAGAFGSHIDVKYAMILGMVPDCDLNQVRSAGNAAGTGARIALLDATSRAVIEESGEAHRESGDRDRAALPAALRRGHGDSAQNRGVCAPAQGGGSAGAEGVREPDARRAAGGRGARDTYVEDGLASAGDYHPAALNRVRAMPL